MIHRDIRYPPPVNQGKRSFFAKNIRGYIHLLITDVVMPTMNGKELEERIEKLKPGIEALFMSGYTVDVIARHGVLAEGVTFIQKPFMMDDFLRKVRKVLGHKHNIDKKRNPY